MSSTLKMKWLVRGRGEGGAVGVGVEGEGVRERFEVDDLAGGAGLAGLLADEGEVTLLLAD